MIYYGKYFFIAYLLILIQSNLFFKDVLNLFVIPDFLLIYIFWLTVENRENLAKYVGLFGGIIFDLINPDKTFVNTLSYLLSAFYIINLKNRFITFNFFLKVLAVAIISLIVSISKTIYMFLTADFLTSKDFQLISFYVLSNTVIMYLIYYFDIFILKRNEV